MILKTVKITGTNHKAEEVGLKLLCLQIYLITKETGHILCVNFLIVNEYDAHLSFHCVKLNKGRLRCTEII